MKHVYTCAITIPRPFSSSSGPTSILLTLNPDQSYAKIIPIQNNVLVPFFFASIGFAVPIREMFDGKTVWKGVIFAILMVFAKVGAGVWVGIYDWVMVRKRKSTAAKALPIAQTKEVATTPATNLTTASPPILPASPQVSYTILPALLLGLGLVARGEIGFVIINLARSPKSGASIVSDEAFKVAVWALTLNTLAGPVAIGLLGRVKMVRTIWREEEQ